MTATKLQSLAEKLGCAPQAAAQLRDQFNDSREARVIIADRLERIDAEKRRGYDKVLPEDLRYLQGILEGVRLCSAALNAKE